MRPEGPCFGLEAAAFQFMPQCAHKPFKFRRHPRRSTPEQPGSPPMTDNVDQEGKRGGAHPSRRLHEAIVAIGPDLTQKVKGYVEVLDMGGTPSVGRDHAPDSGQLLSDLRIGPQGKEETL